MEKEIVKFFAKVMKLDPENCWGFISGASSEALLYAIY